MEEEIVKVGELTPQSRKVNIAIKVLNMGEVKEITSKFGDSKKIAEAVVGDETGTIIMNLWDNQINEISENDLIELKNGYVSLFQSKMRLNIGKYGSIEKSELEISEINEENDMSITEHEQSYRRFDNRRGNRGRNRSY